MPTVSQNYKQALNWKGIVWAVLITTPFVALAVASSQFNVAIPFSDDLLMARPINRLLSDQVLDRQFLFFQINEHMSTVPLMVATIAAALGVYPQATLLLNPLLAAFIVWLFYRLSLQTHPRISSDERLLLAFTTSTYAASWLQWEIWSHSSTMNLMVSNVSVIAAVVLASRSPLASKHFLLVVFCCLAASFSANIGFLAWLVLLPLLWRHAPRSKRSLYIGTHFLCAIIAFTIYSVNYDPDQVLIRKALTWASPINYLHFAAIAVGATLLPLYFWSTAIVGASLLGGMVVSLATIMKRKLIWHQSYLPWILIWVYFALVVAAITIGRGGVSVPGRAFVSRYVALVYPLIISWLYLVYNIYWQPNRRRQLYLRTLTIVLIVFHIVASILALDRWHSRFARLTTGQNCLEFYTIATDECLELIGNSAQDADYIRQSLTEFAAVGIIGDH